ncbi:MAG: Rne/Rng family ribonuclease [Deltaproteobacteria bacterium]|nr:MAG: Rne/Rng family ribonuclease [Deltaproteobacteria bacterium]
MSKKMLINATHPEENRVAIVENGVLTELGIEVAGREPTKGNIYKAAVVRVEPGLQAAFVDYGAERLGFLQIDEVNAAVIKPDFKVSGKPRINDLLHRGQEILVQIVKEERGTKGAALTTYLSLAGRYMVLMPGTPTRGVSRKAEDDKQRKAMKKALNTLDLPENVGCIVRTAALDQTREELERDYLYLMRLYENIQALEKKVRAPALIYKESNLVIRSIRDYFTTDMDEVLIDDPEVHKEAREFFAIVMPDHTHLVKLHQERRPIFSRYQIEEQIETINRNKVPLPSGGSIVIDTTEALVAIDVNSGKMAGETNVESTATRTNLEAAEEVARQLRLRDLGGLIVIDFIDMRERKHNRQVEEKLREATARDKARITIGHISQFGMLEMSRQRIKPALTEGAYRVCPHCQGAGQIRSVETLAVSVLRRLHAALAKGQVAEAEAQMAREVASFLLNEKREELVEMERRYQADITITGRTSFLADQIEFILHKREKEKAAAEYVEAKVTAMPEKSQRPLGRELGEDAEDAAEPAGMAGEPHDEPGKTGKKKRRRKKKKGGAEEAAAEHADSTAAGGAEAGEDAAEPAGMAGEPHDEPGKTGKKKRRRKKKKGGAEEPAAEHADSTAAGDEEAAEEPAEGADAHDEPGKTGKKKRRRRGRKKPAGKTADAAAAPAEAPAVEPAPPAEPVAAEPKKPRPARKKAPAAAEAAEPAAAAPTGAEAETAPAKPKRGTRKKTAATEGVPAEPPPASPASPAPAEPAAGATPKRPRAPRKKQPAEPAGE